MLKINKREKSSLTANDVYSCLEQTFRYCAHFVSYFTKHFISANKIKV